MSKTKKEEIISALRDIIFDDFEVQKMISNYIEIEVKKRIEIIENKYYKNNGQSIKNIIVENDEEKIKKITLLEHKRLQKKYQDLHRACPKVKVSEDELIKIYNYLINNKMLEGEYKHFKIACNSAMPRYGSTLNWIDKKGINNKVSKRFTYTNLFTVLHKYIYIRDNKHFEHPQRKIFIMYLSYNFLFDGKPVKEESINTAYTNWTFNNNLIIE